MRKVVVVACALALAGCATNTRWMKPGGSVADFEQDKVRCEYEASLATANAPVGYGLGGAIGSGIATGIEKVNLMSLCLRAKGWNLEKVAASD